MSTTIAAMIALSEAARCWHSTSTYLVSRCSKTTSRYFEYWIRQHSGDNGPGISAATTTSTATVARSPFDPSVPVVLSDGRLCVSGAPVVRSHKFDAVHM